MLKNLLRSLLRRTAPAAPQPAHPEEGSAALRAEAERARAEEAAELASASVAGAVHIPMGDVPARLAELPRDREVVVLCHAGSRSLRVANFLAAQGFQPVTNLSGGIAAWAVEIGL